MNATPLAAAPTAAVAKYPLVLPRRGARVTLRRLQPSDLRAFQSYRHDVELGRYQGWSPVSDEAALKFLADVGSADHFIPGDWVQIAIADAGTLVLLGDIGIHLNADCTQAEIGFTLQSRSQGHGLATEAVRCVISMIFELTPVDVIIGVTDGRNEASMRLLERVGMKLQSTADAEFRGETCVEHTYAVARKGCAAAAA
jgi:ribosomal-protein-alanine N-acetyltransferase